MTVGFFGKVRSHGDFVSRRLPPEMVAPFDACIQAWLVYSKRELDVDWLPIWSSSPLWRFVLAPGVCGPQAWTGVMMPSADRVGRCFPLILAAGLPSQPCLRDCLTLHANWFAQMEVLALSSLEDRFSIQALDAAAGAPVGAPQLPCAGVIAQSTSPLVAMSYERTLPALADICLEGRSGWWTDGSAMVAPCLAVSYGFPSVTNFPAMLHGRWRDCGWEIV